MGRYRVLAIVALLISAVMSMATDYRLVVASDDPAIRKAGTMVIFEKNGKVTKNDRITSITFSAAADVSPNCLVSLDPGSGKNEVAVSPDVQVFQGKVMIAGSRPTRKVIPAYLTIDVPIPSNKKDASVMAPIIQQVNNLPWVYIMLGLGVFMGIMFMMNRRSQQFTTSMSKEAKNLYLETVGRITDRLEKIESTQERLVKNPPVVRSFKAQIDEFEARLTRIEKFAREGTEEIAKAASQLTEADQKHADILARIEATKAEAQKAQASLHQESDALRAELKLVLKTQDDVVAKLADLEDIKSKSNTSLEATRKLEAILGNQANQLRDTQRAIEAQLAGQEAAAKQSNTDLLKQLATMQSEVQTLGNAQESLKNLPDSVRALSEAVDAFPSQLDSVRDAMPKLDGVESRLDSLEAATSKLDRFDEVQEKLGALQDLQKSIDSVPEKLPRMDEDLNRIHDSLLKQIESLNEKIEHSGTSITEFISAQASLPPAPPAAVHEPAQETGKKGKRAKAKQEDVTEEPGISGVTAESVAEPEPEPPVAEAMPAPEETSTEEVVDVQAEAQAAPEPEAVPEPAVEETPAATEVVAEATTVEEPVVEEPVIEVPAAEEPLSDEEPPTEQSVALEPLPLAEPTSLPGEPVAIEPEISPEVQPVYQVESSEVVEAAPIEDRPAAELLTVEVGGGADSAHLTAKERKKSKKQEEVRELEYRYEEKTSEPAYKEFNFNNAIKKMTEAEAPAPKEKASRAKEVAPAPVSFKLEDLPAKLETFEDDDAEAVLPTLKPVEPATPSNKAEEIEAVKQVLKNLEPKKSAAEDVEAFDHELEDHGAAQMGHWTGYAGSGARKWSSESSRPLELGKFQGDLKPLTPIETAPIGDDITGLTFGFGRVMYACGNTIHGFWPGRDARHLSLDNILPAGDWRLAIKGQSLYVAEEKRVKIVSMQGWFVLEQFTGEYLDQLIGSSCWIGLRNQNGAVLDLRDLRGQMIAQAVQLNMDVEGLQLCATPSRIFAGSKAGKIVEVTQHGTEEIGRGPEGAELQHLTVLDEQPVAVFKTQSGMECWHFGDTATKLDLGIQSYSNAPVLLGNKLYLASLDSSELVVADIKKNAVSRTPAFEGVSGLSRLIGVYHKGQHDLIAITADAGKKGGRLILLDPKSGKEIVLASVGQAKVNLIVADHHVVFSTSSQFQNVIRVLEPFSAKLAA